MPLSAREIQHMRADRQTLINSGIEPEHVYQVLTLIELQRIRSGIENQEVLLESIFEVTRKIEDSMPIAIFPSADDKFNRLWINK